MQTVTADQINWPVAEPRDFQTKDGGETFAIMEDEEGERYYAYGHVPESEFHAELARYVRYQIGDDSEDYPSGAVEHLWAKYTDIYGERFSWTGVTEETQHAFPLTVFTW